LPGPPEKRVFIGGNYNLAPVLRYIRQIVVRGFSACLGDFKVRKSRTYFTSLTLLHQCRVAIFDITLDDGHLLEVHGISKKDNIDLLLLYMALDHKKKMPRGTTSMIESLVFSLERRKRSVGYQSLVEL
jgi:hypothetical protein